MRPHIWIHVFDHSIFTNKAEKIANINRAHKFVVDLANKMFTGSITSTESISSAVQSKKRKITLCDSSNSNTAYDLTIQDEISDF